MAFLLTLSCCKIKLNQCDFFFGSRDIVSFGNPCLPASSRP